MKTIHLTVNGMTCNHCKIAVEKAVKSLEGVESTNVNLKKGDVHVIFNETLTSINSINKAISAEGYEVANVN